MRNIIQLRWFWGGMATLLIFVLYFFLAPWWIYSAATEWIYVSVDYSGDPELHEVALVFGAGITAAGQPSDALRDRLDTAFDLYQKGSISKILVSGDNRFDDYSEPDVMRDYLISRGIPEDAVVSDYAGRRTYDSCARAKEIWGLDSVLLVSQGYHLPRAIFTCQSFGMEVWGMSATRQSYVYEANYKFREFFAIHKAILDVYLLHPDFIGGEPEVI